MERRVSALRIATTPDPRAPAAWDQRLDTPGAHESPAELLDAGWARKNRAAQLKEEYAQCLTPRTARRFHVDRTRTLKMLGSLKGKPLETILSFFSKDEQMRMRRVSRNFCEAVGALMPKLILEVKGSKQLPAISPRHASGGTSGTLSANRGRSKTVERHSDKGSAEPTAASLVHLFQYASGVQEVEFRKISALDSDVILAALKGCPKLRIVRVIQSDTVTSIDLSAARPPEGLSSFALQHLEFRACKSLSSIVLPPNRDDSALSVFTNLTGFSLKSCAKIEDKVVKNLAAHVVIPLESLDVSLCTRISQDGALPLVVTFGKTLKRLSVSQLRVGDEFVRCLQQNAPLLTHLDVGRCSSITDTTMSFIAQMPCLQWLCVASCNRVTNAGLRYLCAPASKCVHLRYIDLSTNMGITDQGIASLSAVRRELEAVLLNETAVTTAGVMKLVQHANQLVELQVGDCLLMDGSVCSTLAANCPKLERLNLAGAVVTMQHIAPLNHKCKKLKILDLTNTRCTQDRAAIKQILWTCAGLQPSGIFL
jgi:hypothetical protein